MFGLRKIYNSNNQSVTTKQEKEQSEAKHQENKEDVGSVRTSSLDENKQRNIENVHEANPTKELNENTQPTSSTKTHQPNHHFSFGHRQHSFNKQPHPELSDKAKAKLSKKQVDKLLDLLNEEYEIVSKDGTLKITSSAAEILARITQLLRCEKVPFMASGIRFGNNIFLESLIFIDLSEALLLMLFPILSQEN